MDYKQKYEEDNMITEENIPYTGDEIKAMVKTCEKYNKALERARQFSEHPLQEDSADIVEYIFPELVESEDEKMRKMCMRYLDWEYQHCYFNEDKMKLEKCIAWLEKQGETDPCIGCTNDKGCVTCENGNMKETKAEPKFHPGDWIVDNIGNIFQIERVFETITKDIFGYITVGGVYFNDNNDVRLWTIQDAKDGDALCTYECDEPKIVFILKGAPKKHYALSYHCYYNIMYPYFVSDSENGCLAPKDENVKPATKEQRDLLYSKMKQEGFEWNAEKKELKKIEQKPVDKVGPKFKAGDWL